MANSLTDLAKSIDWGKVMSGADARNALIGSALGGAILGGAGLMQERDPEESKLAPVGDALLGSVLGGAAGYGIPKAVQLIRDSGALAPDSDKISTNYLGWGLGGAGVGAGVFGRSLHSTLSRAARSLERDAKRTFSSNAAGEAAKYLDAARRGASPKELDRLSDRVMMFNDPTDVEELLAKQRRSIADALRRKDTGGARAAWERYKELANLRKVNTRGYGGIITGDGLDKLLERAADEAVRSRRVRPKGILRSFLSRIRDPGLFTTHGSRYRLRAPWWTLGLKTVSPRGHMLARGGKYAAGGAALAMLLHKILGPSASNNYKN